MKKTFPTLYKKTATGATQMWEIEVDDNVIISRHGQVGGAITESAPDVIREGKNIGRSNATTPEQQALLEAQSDWEKKLKKGYVQDIDAAKKGETDACIEGGFFPMLAKRYDEDGDKIVFPCYVQPKFDGHRCCATPGEDGTTYSLWSRTRKPITGVPHIVAEIERLEIHHTNLDGECYQHDYHDRFEELSSFIRQVTPKAGFEVVQYHIYDIANPELDFEARHNLLTLMLGTPEHPKSKILIPVETVKVNNEDELMLAFERFLKAGYEGCMVRNAKGKYMFKRSPDLQKVKEFKDSEYKIVRVEEGRGMLSGHGIFVCVTPEGVEFAAKMVGEIAELKKYYEHPEKYIGKALTVKYQGLTTKSKVPRFPVALRIREDV